MNLKLKDMIVPKRKEKEVFMVTRDENWKNRQQRNKLKGMVQEWLLKYFYKEIGIDVRNDEERIDKIIGILKEKLKNERRWLVKKKFMLDENGEKTVFSQRYKKGTEGDMFFELKDKQITKNTTLKVKENVVKTITKETTTKIPTGWYECDNPVCDVKISEDYKKSNRCLRCRKYGRSGWLKPQYKIEKIPKDTTKKITEWVEKAKGKENIIGYIEKNKYTTKVKHIITKRRLDGWVFHNNTLIIFESKNKEKTKLQFTDVFQLINYCRIILKSNLNIERCRIILNGDSSKKIHRFLNNRIEDYDIEIISLFDLCKKVFDKKNRIIENIIITKKGQHRLSKNGEYFVNIKETRVFPKNITIGYGFENDIL